MNFKLHGPSKGIKGSIRLDGSKSISNRALIIQALAKAPFQLRDLSTAKDTETMAALLSSTEEVRDVGPAGTTFRFLTAYLALQPGRQILTGSERMQERPIGALVDALNALGAKISYQKNSGYPPLVIDSPGDLKHDARLTMPASISSQFISALLLIGPALPGGVTIQLEGELVSPSYLNMTIEIMRHFGAGVEFSGQRIRVEPTGYEARDFTVEADWSAASYHYALAALASDVNLTLDGLFEHSWQGDAVCTALFSDFGVQSSWDQGTLRLTKSGKTKQTFRHHYIDCPDIAQTIAAVSAGMGMPALFTGLETLRIKETDRIAALKQELMKVGVAFYALPAKLSGSDQETFMIDGKAVWTDPPRFATYHDHRMAMSLAPLGLLHPIIIEDIGVVDKSYPDFWKHLVELGFRMEMIS